MSAARLYPIMAREPLRAMFTGLVQSVGRIERRAGAVVVWGCAPFAPLALGDSVAVDGVCLTAAELVADGFRADVSEETLRRTTLGRKADRGCAVNLEPALRLSDRLGGHLVAVMWMPPVKSPVELPHSWALSIRWSEARFGRYVCEKASIAVDGISLTVAGVQLMEPPLPSPSSPTPGRRRPETPAVGTT